MSGEGFIWEHWEGLAEFGVVAAQLPPGEKFTTRRWSYFEDLHAEKGRTRIDLVSKWLNQGYGVGYFPRGGVMVLDCDVPKGLDYMPMYERVESWMASNYRTAPLVDTPNGGLHLIGRLPPDLSRERLKNHICHPTIDGYRQPWDWKLFERTLVVGPGTVSEKNGIRRAYLPRTPWIEPPILDPRWIEPQLELYLPESEPFLRDSRPLSSRIPRAVNYLTHKAPISISGQGGGKSLRVVAEHLVAYLDLDPGLAFWLMTNPENPSKSWNARCRKADGTPSPWSDRDLFKALEQAVDAIPAYGRFLYQEAEETAYREWCYAAFLEILGHVPATTGVATHWMLVGDLLAEFTRLFDLDPARCNAVDLGKRLTRAIEDGRIPLQKALKGHGRLTAYTGVDADLLRVARLAMGYEQIPIRRAS